MYLFSFFFQVVYRTIKTLCNAGYKFKLLFTKTIEIVYKLLIIIPLIYNMCVYMYVFESFSNIKLILLKYTIHIVIILLDFLIQNNSKIGSAFIEKKKNKN